MAEERWRRKSVMVLGTKEGLKSKLSSGGTEPIGSCFLWWPLQIQILFAGEEKDEETVREERVKERK